MVLYLLCFLNVIIRVVLTFLKPNPQLLCSHCPMHHMIKECSCVFLNFILQG